MANPWFRLYSEFATDPKVQRMSETDQRRFIMLLCMRCSNGNVTLHDDDVAFQLRISNDDWFVTKGVLLSKNLIDEDNLPVAWDLRQFVSDSSAPRVAKHRAKKKEVCSVTVTAPEQIQRTESDTEQIQNRAKSKPLPVVKSVSDKQMVIAEDESALQAACRETWRSYASAYQDAKGEPPVTNAKVRSQVKQLVQRLPYSEAPQVAAWYVSHRASFYVSKGHDIGPLLADAEKLRTEWATGRMVTATSAQQSDRTQSNFNSANEAIRILEGARA